MRKPTMWILTRSDINQAGQPLKVARGLKFCIKEVEVLYYPSSENKDADQLRGYLEADLRPCFRIRKTLVFARGGSIIVTNLLIAQPYTKEKITRARVPMVTNLLKAPPYTKEKFSGARVPPSLRGQSKRNCPLSWPGYSLRAIPRPSPWVGDGVWGVDTYGWCNRKSRSNTIYISKIKLLIGV